MIPAPTAEDPTCVRCGCEYALRSDHEPTPHCDQCAHEAVAELMALNAELAAALRAIVPFAIQDEKPYEDRPIPEQHMSPELLTAYKSARAALAKVRPQ